jgi:hypothetical protein
MTIKFGETMIRMEGTYVPEDASTNSGAYVDDQKFIAVGKDGKEVDITQFVIDTFDYIQLEKLEKQFLEVVE